MKTTNKDPWKSLVDENREEFNRRKPRDLWNAIEEELEKDQKSAPTLIPLWKVYRIAAVFVVALGVGYFMMYHHFSSGSDKQVAQQEKVEKVEAEPVYPEEFIEAENYYTAEIEQKTNELIKLTDDKVVVEEIQELRQEFEELREEMGDHINDERIIQAMIQNYRLRLELLKEILGELKTDGEPIKNTAYGTEAI